MSRVSSLDDPCSHVPLTGDKQHEDHAALFHTRRHTALPSGAVSLPAQDDGEPLATLMVVSSNGDHLVLNAVGDVQKDPRKALYMKSLTVCCTEGSCLCQRTVLQAG
jgi:hypothetical protein